MRETEKRAREAYVEQFGGEPEVVASAPGRINLIGEHTDYNEGFVLPCAIDRRIAIAAARNGGEMLYSADFDRSRPLHLEDDSWAKYPRGVAWALREAGHEADSFQAALAGDVPRASGLSSSAAVEAATALALDWLFGSGLDKKTLARICQRAENEYVGVASGIMDQYASLLGEAGSALLIDCRSLEAESVPLDLEGVGLSLIVCDTRVERGLADTGYNDRRAACERAAETLGVEALRDATEADLDRLSGEELRRARHVVTENARVLRAAESLRGKDFEVFGHLMYASHESMRDDYEISTPELDAFVETAKANGAPGARLTGAGFGGCAIALMPSGNTETLAEACRLAFADLGFGEPEFYEFVPAAGAEVVG
ncbi:MAG: Galactokinase [uncultured Rubrobacteraceae bacterium]|uniref:Galactokinase n=1 Tax=uncultured Rubrobacteraceae bacterium TaxID=349277 RepID=A0A6J4QDV7_9ACTN|nr:MAG: Galactokinase [uncultured Rubrobacteraceae bacterium]